MQLWRRWLKCVEELRPACGRRRTFLWMVLVLAGFSTRPERAGITSLVRVLVLRERAYRRLLHLFHSSVIYRLALRSCCLRISSVVASG